jgi:hypothetical protein
METMNATAAQTVEQATTWFGDTVWLGDTVESARELLARHDHFRGRANTFDMCECNGVLLVRGQVPTFYLKQLLQSALENVVGVWKVENRVDVVSPDGLSSVRRR